MDAKPKLIILQAIQKILNLLDELDISVEQSYDFEELESLGATLDGHEITEQAQTQKFDFAPKTGFWLGAYNNDGDCLSVQAGRVEDITGKTLSNHWRTQQSRLYGGSLGGDNPPVASKMTGRIAYHGDFWVSPKARGTAASILLVRLGYLMIQDEFDPQYLYGFMGIQNIESSLHTRFGWPHSYPRGNDWTKPPAHISPDDYFLYFEEGDLHNLAVNILKDDPKLFPYIRTKRDVKKKANK